MAVHSELSPTEAADRLALRELFDGYAHCADRRDAEGQKALFTDDAVFAVYEMARPIAGARSADRHEALVEQSGRKRGAPGQDRLSNGEGSSSASASRRLLPL